MSFYEKDLLIEELSGYVVNETSRAETVMRNRSVTMSRIFFGQRINFVYDVSMTCDEDHGCVLTLVYRESVNSPFERVGVRYSTDNYTQSGLPLISGWIMHPDFVENTDWVRPLIEF